jgi:SNF2 family DNA or RNA helicase
VAVVATSIQQITDELLTPLCDETKRMFRPIRNLKDTDRIRLSMVSADSKWLRATFGSTSEWGEASYYASNNFPAKIPEKERSKKDWNVWKFAITDITALLISYHFKPHQIEFGDDLSQMTYRYLLTNYLSQTMSIQGREDTDGFEFIDHPHFPLSWYQIRALKAVLPAEAFALFMEQGTGKTPVTIATMCNMAAKADHMYRCLIVCPNNVRTNWKEEIAKFTTLPGRVTIINGTETKRNYQLIDAMRKPANGEKFSCVIASYDGVATTPMMTVLPWDLTALDESHYIKASNTRRWKEIRKLRDMSKKRMVLTGSPIANNMFDLWTQLEFLGEGWSGFSGEKPFRRFYGEYVNTGGQGQGYEKLTGMKNVPLIQERLARVSYLIEKKTALPDLPKTSNKVIEVEMTKEQVTIYNQLATQLAAEIESDLSGDNVQLACTNVLTKMLRLAQVTSGFVGIPEELGPEGEVVSEKQVKSFAVKPKLEAVVEYLKGRSPAQKTIIWACWTHDIDALYERLCDEGFHPVKYTGATSYNDREAAKQSFNCDPRCTVLLGNAGAGGTGLNLLGYDFTKPFPAGETVPATYCDSVIYYSQDWSSLKRMQSEARAHRRGTMFPVVYIDLTVLGTIDEEIRERVINKRDNAASIQDIRGLVERIKKVTYNAA